MGCIYLITNTINEKQYVGKTISTVDVRWDQHVKASQNGNNMLICKAIRKYGAEAFTIEVLNEIDDRDDLRLFEAFWITFLETNINGYNVTSGGEGGAIRKGMKTSNETKKKISQSMKGRKHSETTIQNMRNAQKGKLKSEEHKHKIGEGIRKSLRGNNS